MHDSEACLHASKSFAGGDTYAVLHYPPPLTGWFLHPQLAGCAARDIAAKLVGLTAGGLPAEEVAALLDALVSAFPGREASHEGAAPVRFEEQDGSIAATGYVTAECLSGEKLLVQCCFTSGLIWY